MELLVLNLQTLFSALPRENLGSAGLNPINPYIFGKLMEILGSSLYFRKGRARFGASGAKNIFLAQPNKSLRCRPFTPVTLIFSEGLFQM